MATGIPVVAPPLAAAIHSAISSSPAPPWRDRHRRFWEALREDGLSVEAVGVPSARRPLVGVRTILGNWTNTDTAPRPVHPPGTAAAAQVRGRAGRERHPGQRQRRRSRNWADSTAAFAASAWTWGSRTSGILPMWVPSWAMTTFVPDNTPMAESEVIRYLDYRQHVQAARGFSAGSPPEYESRAKQIKQDCGSPLKGSGALGPRG